MLRYFSGPPTDLGNVAALPHNDFASLCSEVFEKPIRLKYTTGEFSALPPKDSKVSLDQQRAKKSRYVTPAAFAASPSPRRGEFAQKCNLVCLDIDPDKITKSTEDAKRILADQGAGLGDFGYAIWHTASSTLEAPRLRVVVSAEGIPLTRYEHAVRTIGAMLNITKITSESIVPVQPMYLPIMFADSGTSPLVATNPTGAAFTVADITFSPEFDDSVDASALPVDDADGPVADIEFLRAPLENVTMADAEEAMKHLSADCGMQEWVEVGMALKHQFGEEGFDLWDTWSQASTKYAGSDDTEYRWKSFKSVPNRVPVTIRSVFKKATDAGWNAESLRTRTRDDLAVWLRASERTSEELLDQGALRIVKAGAILTNVEQEALKGIYHRALASRDLKVPANIVNRQMRELEREAKTGGVPAWAKGWVFVTSADKFVKVATGRQFKPEVLDRVFSRPPLPDEKYVAPQAFLLQTVNTPTVESLRYEPKQADTRLFKEDGIPYFNTYRKNPLQPDKDRADEAGELYLAHMANLIREPEFQRTITDYLAFHIQRPGEKVNWAPLIQSTKGAGKSFLAEMMAVLLGRQNTMKVEGSIVMDRQYNDWAYSHQLVILEEVRVVGTNRYAVMDKLKPLITDTEISLNEKFASLRKVPNVSNYLLFTNHHDSLAVQDDERRYFVVASPLQTREQVAALGEDYFEKLFAMLYENAAGLLAWFQAWPISKDFKPKGNAPVTKYLHELAENAASPLAAAVRAATTEESLNALVRSDLLSMHELRTVVASSPGLKGDFSDQALAHVLRELGWIKAARVMLEGTRHQLWTRNLKGDAAHIAKQRMELL